MKKYISLLLSIVLLLSMFSGCCCLTQPVQVEDEQQNHVNDLLDEIQVTEPQEDQSEEDDFQDLFGEPAEPVSIPGMEYTLNQDMIDQFYEYMQRAEELAIAGENLNATENALMQVDESYMELIDQYQIAYVLYCMDQSNETGKERYLECVDLVADLDADYNAMCKRIYLSGTPLRDALFAEWTQEDIDMLLAYNDEIAQLEKRNSELTVEYRDLDEFNWEENMVELYNEMVQNNNRIAEIYGYENYYAYAYDQIYQRDYEMDSIYLMRRYAAKYLPDIATMASERLSEIYSQLDFTQQMQVSTMLSSSYDELEENYVELFIQDMPLSSQNAMNDMFNRDKVVFTDSETAYDGAFTTLINNEPFCYFGPGYDGSDTVIHELGHYYGTLYADFWNQPMDLAETQSQGNEWMYINFLQKHIDPQMHEALVEYRLVSDASYILCFVMIDQFEEQVYTHPNAGNLTLEEYEDIMDEVAEDYGGIDMISENFMDIQTYWKYVVLESPVYYISYAVSGISAINLFTIAQENEDLAKEVYCRLMEEPQEGQGFLANITYAGLEGPFDETVYQQIYSRYVN